MSGDATWSSPVTPGLIRGPATSVAFVADMPLGPLAREVELGVPLPMPVTERADTVEPSAAVLDRDAVEGMGVVGVEAMHDAGDVGHGVIFGASEALWLWRLSQLTGRNSPSILSISMSSSPTY